MRMHWNRCENMYEAISYIQGREMNPDPITPANYVEPPVCYAEVVTFTDGTAIACRSKWDKIYDEPDDVKWWIGKKVEEKEQNGNFILVDW